MKYQEEFYYQFQGRAFPLRETVTVWSPQTSFLLLHPSVQPWQSSRLPQPSAAAPFSSTFVPFDYQNLNSVQFYFWGQILLLHLTYATPEK